KAAPRGARQSSGVMNDLNQSTAARRSGLSGHSGPRSSGGPKTPSGIFGGLSGVALRKSSRERAMIHSADSRAELDTLAYLLVDLDLVLVRDLHDQREPLAVELSRPPG